MARRLLGMPLKNITNRQYDRKGFALGEAERAVFESHLIAEEKEICSMKKYIHRIAQHYEELDRTHRFEENDITYEMRSLLADWLINCAEKLNLSDDTLYLCIYLIDRFLSGRKISANKLQLVGITALVIAAKYEEVVYPDLGSFLMLSDGSFTAEDIKKAEKYMMYSIDYRMEYVNPLFFLRRVARANNYEARSRKMGKYFMELMMLYPAFIKYKKNVLGTTAMYLARKICQADYNKNLFFYYARIDRGDIRSCFDELVKIIYSSPQYENIESKYAKPSMFEVSTVARKYAQQYFN